MFEIPVLPVCAAFDLINQESVLGREGMTVVCSFKDLKIESKGLGYTGRRLEVKVEEFQCSNCKEFGGWIQMRRPDRTCERPWCSKWNEFCQPQKHECKKEGGEK